MAAEKAIIPQNHQIVSISPRAGQVALAPIAAGFAGPAPVPGQAGHADPSNNPAIAAAEAGRQPYFLGNPTVVRRWSRTRDAGREISLDFSFACQMRPTSRAYWAARSTARIPDGPGRK
jgi:hypothetical protein